MTAHASRCELVHRNRVRRPGRDVDVATLQAHVMDFAERGIVSKYAVPDRILFVETLDKTSVGKLDKKAMRAKFA